MLKEANQTDGVTGLSARRIGLSVAAVVLMATLGPVTGLTQVIYQHNFGGAGGLLNGVAADVSPGGELWSASSFLNDNGTINGSDEGSAILPFVPQINRIYTLSLDVTTGVGVDRWVALGFCRDPLITPGGTTFDDRFSNGAEGKSWMLIRDHSNNPQDVEIFGGLRTANVIPDNDALFTFGITHTLTIVLDTTGDGSTYTADFRVDGASVSFGPQQISTLSDINFVGISFDNSSATPPTVDNFVLTEQAGPPPKSWDGDVSNLWSVAANWTGDTTPDFFGFADSVRFADPNSGASGTVLNDIVGAQLSQIVFLPNAQPFTLTGNAVEVAAGISNLNDPNDAVQQVALDITATGSLAVNAGGPLHLSGKISGTGGLNKAGNAPLVLSNALNDFSGPVSYSGLGSIVLSASGALGDPSSTMQLNAYFQGPITTLELDGGVTQGKQFHLGARIEVDVPHFVAVSGANAITGSMTTDAGGDRFEFVAEAGASLDIVADLTATGTGLDYMRASGDGDVSFVGQIDDTTGPDTIGVLRNSGTGTLNIVGAKLYGGPTTTSSGRIAFIAPASTNCVPNSPLLMCHDPNSAAFGTLDFSGLFGGRIVLVSGQTLGGNGGIIGGVTAAAGSRIAPGRSPGTLVIPDLRLEAGAILEMEIGQGGHDRINIGAGGSIQGPSSGAVSISVLNAGDIASGTYTILDWSAASSVDVQLSDFTTSAGTLAIVGSQLQLTVDVTPVASILVADTGNNRVLNYSATNFGGMIPDAGDPVFAEGVVGAFLLESPSGMTKDSAGNVYLAEADPDLQDRVMKLDALGNYIDTVAEVDSFSPNLNFSGTPGHLVIDPTDTYMFMSISQPNSTANDPNMDDVIYRVDLSGATPPQIYIPTTDVGGTYVLQDPQGLAFGNDGYLYVSNNLDPLGSPDNGSRILRFDVSGPTAVFAGVLTTEHRATKALFYDDVLERLVVSLNNLNDIWAYSDLSLDYVAIGDPSYSALFDQNAGEVYPYVVVAAGEVFFTDSTNDVVRRIDTPSSAPVALGPAAGLLDPTGLLVLAEYDPFDFDNDGDVDSDDLESFLQAMSGPDDTTPPSGVSGVTFRRADIDKDGDVDMKDMWAVMRRVNG